MTTTLLATVVLGAIAMTSNPAGAQHSDLIKDAKRAASWVAKNLSASGYRSDFSLSSIWDLERFFEEHSEHGKPKAGGLLDSDNGQRLFALAAYLGETWRRAGNGTWDAPATDVSDDLKDFEIAVVFPNGVRAWPGRAVMVRYFKGKDAGDLVAASIQLEQQNAFKWRK